MSDAHNAAILDRLFDEQYKELCSRPPPAPDYIEQEPCYYTALGMYQDWLYEKAWQLAHKQFEENDDESK